MVSSHLVLCRNLTITDETVFFFLFLLIVQYVLYSYIYYDAPEDTLSSFAENCGILKVTQSQWAAEDEMPPWEAGFMLPNWTIQVGEQLYLLPG